MFKQHSPYQERGVSYTLILGDMIADALFCTERWKDYREPIEDDTSERWKEYRERWSR